MRTMNGYNFVFLQKKATFVPMKSNILMLLCIYGGVLSASCQQPAAMPSSYVAGNASVAYVDRWLPLGNPAAIGRAKDISLGIIYENRYITKELSTKSINLSIPTAYINTGVSLSHFGYSEYNEMIVAATAGRKFGQKLLLGVDIVYYMVSVADTHKRRGTLTAQVGTQIDLSDNLTVALRLLNPMMSKISSEETDKHLPTTLSVGLLYRIRDEVIWLVDIDKETQSPIRWATGFEYALVKELVVRLGAYGYRDFRPTLGAGLRFDRWQFDISSDYNSVLGFSLLGGVRYKL